MEYGKKGNKKKIYSRLVAANQEGTLQQVWMTKRKSESYSLRPREMIKKYQKVRVNGTMQCRIQ